eukprot:3152095-Amphidinium_carterae.1
MALESGGECGGIRERAALQLTSLRSLPGVDLVLCCQAGHPSMFNQCGGRTRDLAKAATGCPRSASLPQVLSRPDGDPTVPKPWEGKRCAGPARAIET